MHLQTEIEKLKTLVLGLSAKVENDVRMAVRAADNRDETIALKVVGRERETNAMEVDVEEECLKILALHQPVAGDLRYIVAVLKINQDLERIGDLAVHIAESAIALGERRQIPLPVRMEQMAAKTEAILQNVLDAFVRLDGQSAHGVFAADREIDSMNQAIFRQARELILNDPQQFDALIQVMNIARHLERIGDHATNIAEDLIYLVEGRIVRHNPEISGKSPQE